MSMNSPPATPPPPHCRILFIDAYDSFTHNLVDQITRCTSAEVHVIHIDAPFTKLVELIPHLPSFDAVVIGPGPGSPENPVDIGIVKDLWHLGAVHLLPVFGVCLGLQSLCLAFGGVVSRLHTVKHGLSAKILHNHKHLFEGIAGTSAIRYHSLHAQLPTNEQATELEPLAWAVDEENGDVLMAVKHKEKPFWAVQYHPESICTEDGDQIIRNFWRMAVSWNNENRRKSAELLTSWGMLPREPNLLEQAQASGYTNDSTKRRKIPYTVQTVSLSARGLKTKRICEILGVKTQQQFVLLDSAATPGEWSIIGVLSPDITKLIQYYVGDDYATLSRLGNETNQAIKVKLQMPYPQSMWQFLASFMQVRKATGGKEESPFWGGFLGYFSYELGVDKLGIPLLQNHKRRLDVNLAFAERSIVVNVITGKIYIQSLVPDDGEWLYSIKSTLQQEYDIAQTPTPTPPLDSPEFQDPLTAPKNDFRAIVKMPSKASYTALVRDSQAFLASGDSYELCLTARTKITLPSCPHPWDLYNRLRTRNAAPYAAYLKLNGLTLLSSSPERFLSYSRTGRVQLRPIKGTVKKSPTMTFECASAILNTPKERAENLMILDLIRHDLHRILGPRNVRVDKLMGVEEYVSVYQLVSVISGDLGPSGATGLDVLASSLPPGSMTGAPKKRSVQILQTLEKDDEQGRGVYSGVVGYMSVCGAGDWSVVIRSAYRYDDEEDAGQWWVGAGGAVTALSSPEDEYEEMVVKLESTLGAFDIQT